VEALLGAKKLAKPMAEWTNAYGFEQSHTKKIRDCDAAKASGFIEPANQIT